MNFKCPKCGKSAELAAHEAGQDIECPVCGADIRYSGDKIYSGRIIAGFELQELLGIGGMGEVWLAYQQSMDRQVAIKILSPYLAKDKSFVENFLEEVKLAAKLEHPNIVSAFDAGVEDDIYYLAMSYVPGETFAVRIAREKRLPEQEILKVAVCIGKALQYAWGKYHILHRDVNPSNIMLTPEGDIKLMDMGISKNMEEDSKSDEDYLLGTPNYISPEQIRGNLKLDVRSDIYSLGATLYHLATGVVPFDSEDTYQILDRQLEQNLPPVCDINPSISRPCSQLIGKMLSKDRDSRPPTWGSFLHSVDQLGKNTPAKSDGKSGTTVAPSSHRQVRISKEQIRKVHEDHERQLARRRKKQLMPMLVVSLALIALAGYLGIQLLGRTSREAVEYDRLSVDPDGDEGSSVWDRQPSQHIDRDERIMDADRLAVREWNRIRNLEVAEPDGYDQLIDSYTTFLELDAIDDYEEQARSRLLQLENQRRYKADIIMSELEEKASALIQEEDFDAAIAVFEGYRGILSEFTRDQRRALADEYRERVARASEERERQERDAAILDEFLTSLAPDIASGNLREVVSKCNSFQQRAVSDELKSAVADLKHKIEEIRSIDQSVIDILASGEVEEVVLPVAGEQRRMSFHSVDGNTITVGKERGRGMVYFDFSIRQIPAIEKYNMTEGVVDEVTRELFIGIHYFRREQFDRATDHFLGSGIIAEHMQEYVAEHRKGLDNERVESLLKGLLQAAGLMDDEEEDIDWDELSNIDVADVISYSRASSMVSRIDEIRESFDHTEFLDTHQDSIANLLDALKSIPDTGDSLDEDTSEMHGVTSVSEQRFYELRARSTRGRPLRVNPLGREGGIIPELVAERLDRGYVMTIQSGDYNNRPIEVSRLRDVAIKVDPDVRNCIINISNSENITIQGVGIERIVVRDSSFVLLDSQVTHFDSQGAKGLIHNTRIRYAATGGDLTFDHCLIASIEARDRAKIHIRNSILYGRAPSRHGRMQWLPIIRMHRSSRPEITMRNTLVFTETPLALAHEHSYFVSRPEYRMEEGSREYPSLADMGRFVELTDVSFEDPVFADYEAGNYNLRFNSPAKRSSISRRNDLGPHPTLRPFPF